MSNSGRHSGGGATLRWRADEVGALVASISRRDDAACRRPRPTPGGIRLPRPHHRTQSRAAHMQLVSRGAEAFGVQFLVDVVLAAFGKGLGEDASLWAADAALDELAALAASTNPDHWPRRRARRHPGRGGGPAGADRPG